VCTIKKIIAIIVSSDNFSFQIDRSIEEYSVNYNNNEYKLML